MEAGKWYATKDNDNWIDCPGFASEAEAVAGAPVSLSLKPGEKFWVGLAVEPSMPLDSDAVLEMLDTAADDDGCPSGLEPYEVSHGAREELDELLSAWAEKHGVKPLWVGIEDVSEHAVSAA